MDLAMAGLVSIHRKRQAKAGQLGSTRINNISAVTVELRPMRLYTGLALS